MISQSGPAWRYLMVQSFMLFLKWKFHLLNLKSHVYKNSGVGCELFFKLAQSFFFLKWIIFVTIRHSFSCIISRVKLPQKYKLLIFRDVIVYVGCHKKIPKTKWLNTPPPILEAKSPWSTCGQILFLRVSSHGLFSVHEREHFLVSLPFNRRAPVLLDDGLNLKALLN